MTTTDQPLRVHWVLDELTRAEDGRWNSVHASNRFRGLIPAEELLRLGHHVQVFPMGDWAQDATDTEAVPDVVVVGRLFVGPDAERRKRHGARVLRRIRKERMRGVPVVADVCDDHVQNREEDEHWRSIARLADACVVNSKLLAARVARQTDAPVHVVDDPIGSPRGQPAVFRPRATTLWQRIGIGMATPLRLCWYGSTGNWPSMEAWIDALAKDMPVSRLLLRVVTAPCEPIQRFVQQWNAARGSAFKIEHVAWSEETQWEVVKDSDVVLLPSDPADPQNAERSSSDLADALHAGRFVLATPIEAYQSYARYASLTDEPAQALRAYLNDPDASLVRVSEGQTVAARRGSSSAIAQRWMKALDPSTTKPAAAPGTVSQSAAPVRLNLGCGDKILRGYENVDVVASRLGRTPDVLCDLHDLAVFPDDYADEVMAIHVVEHFWRWEIEDVLREWVRVLKPGGSMVLECPNLISACEEFLRDPERHSGQGQEGQRTMWVFYGDPAWKDPYMNHRWGYTPESLKALMEAVGLVEVRQEPAQYKLREPRDMRVVGVKPR